MAATPQSYKNHARILPAFHYFVLPALLVNVLVEGGRLWGAPSLGSLWSLVVAVVLFFLALLARTQALTVQDRIIRLEMHLRLLRILPADLQGRIRELSSKQLVGLRFASDGELPDLVRDVLSGALKTPKEIKLRVRDWQGDYLRA